MRSPTLLLRWGCNHFCWRCKGSSTLSIIAARIGQLEIALLSKNGGNRLHGKHIWRQQRIQAATKQQHRCQLSRPQDRRESRVQALTDKYSLSTLLQWGKLKETHQWEFFISWGAPRFSSLISPKFPRHLCCLGIAEGWNAISCPFDRGTCEPVIGSNVRFQCGVHALPSRSW